MAEQTYDRETFKIVRTGQFFKVYNDKHLFDQLFTEYNKAEQFIESYIRAKEEDEFRKAVKRLHKIEDLKQRSKEYKRLCQVYKK